MLVSHNQLKFDYTVFSDFFVAKMVHRCEYLSKPRCLERRLLIFSLIYEIIPL